MSAPFEDRSDQLDYHAVQTYLNSLSWDYPYPRKNCELCGKSFAARGTREYCDDCTESCSHSTRIVGRKVYRSGIYHPESVCMKCGKMISLRAGAGPGKWIFRDNREHEAPHPCARCGSDQGSEQHHWAPRAIFGDLEAERWPVSYLCPTCHRLWHDQMRAGKGVSIPLENRIDDSITAWRREGVS